MKLHLSMFKTTTLAGLATVALLSAGTASAGTIVGSAHDTSTDAWNTTGEICVVCHTPHIFDGRPTQVPLWNHEITTATHTMYSSGTLNGAIDGSPSDHSLLCLSCHDGTVALDSFGGATGATYIPSGRRTGTDLTNDHPVSIEYSDSSASADGALFAPSTTSTTIGSGADTKTGTIAELMTYSGKVQCTSCHDVHNKFTAASTPLLKRTMVGSALCLTCHNK
jgi:predicted CXXCH cytochrome family protein